MAWLIIDLARCALITHLAECEKIITWPKINLADEGELSDSRAVGDVVVPGDGLS